mgnify:FL=1
MRIKKIKVYTFDELSDKAKEKAINWYREGNDLSYTWEDMQADAKNIGLKLKGTHQESMDGDFIESASVCADAILREHGKMCETYKTAQKFITEHEKIWADYREKEAKGEDTNQIEYEIEDCKDEFLKSILEDYRIMQEKDEEYQNSDEVVIESIQINEYEFDENGERV